MKVVKMPKTWSMKVKCTGANNIKHNKLQGKTPCRAILEITEEDIILTHIKGHIFYSIKCPCCDSLTDIKVLELPKNVREYVIERNLDGVMALFEEKN